MWGPNLGYADTWKILEEMVADFRKKGRPVPTRIMNDLKSARTMIRILKADPNCGETIQKIEGYLGSVESYLVSEGEKAFGKTYAEEWLRRLGNESRRFSEEKEEIRFVLGLPREHGWVCVKPSAELTTDVLKAMVADLTLSYKTQDDGSLLVCGKRERIRNFVKKMTTEYGSKAKE
jgi:hypothetical protein